MSIDVIVFNKLEHHKIWDDFVNTQSLNGNFQHTRLFYNHNPYNESRDHSLLFFKEGTLIALLPANLEYSDGYSMLVSHNRATFGGILISSKVGMRMALNIVESIIKHAQEFKINKIQIRQPFKILSEISCDQIDYALWNKGFIVTEREVEIFIPLKKSYELIRREFDKGTKSNIAKATRDISVQFTEDFEKFWPILDKNLMEKFGVHPVHSLNDILNLRNLVGKNVVKLVCGYKDDKMVCGIVLFDFNCRVLHCQYIGNDNDNQNSRPVNAVLDYVIRWGIENKYEFLNLGKPTTEGGRVLNEGLAHFKESFGGQSNLRETMELVIN